MMRAGACAGACSGATRAFILFAICSLAQLVVSDPGDEACLTHLYYSLEDPTKSLKNWTKPNFFSPCNGFESHLQGATCNNGRIFKLSLSNLSLRGKISPFLSNCTNLQSLDLSSNSITGQIPPDIKALVNLAVLNLSANQIGGQIPPELASCAYLNVIDLHDNLLSGQIPQELAQLVRLSSFDVSVNRLSGEIPPGLGLRAGVPRFNATSFEGNKELYGYPLEEGYKRKGGLTVVEIVGIGLGSGFLSLVVSFAVVCVWLRATEQKMEAEQGKVTQLMPDY